MSLRLGGYLYSNYPGSRAVYPFVVPRSGVYEVRVRWQKAPNREKAVQVVLTTADGEKSVSLDQTLAPEEEPPFGTLGHFRFEAGKEASR